jgi:hypothetical protein
MRWVVSEGKIVSSRIPRYIWYQMPVSLERKKVASLVVVGSFVLFVGTVVMLGLYVPDEMEGSYSNQSILRTRADGEVVYGSTDSNTGVATIVFVCATLTLYFYLFVCGLSIMNDVDVRIERSNYGGLTIFFIAFLCTALLCLVSLCVAFGMNVNHFGIKHYTPLYCIVLVYAIPIGVGVTGLVGWMLWFVGKCIVSQCRKCALLWCPVDPDADLRKCLAKQEKERVLAEKLRLKEEQALAVKKTQVEAVLQKEAELQKKVQVEAEKERKETEARFRSQCPAPSGIQLAVSSMESRLDPYCFNECTLCMKTMTRDLEKLSCGHIFHQTCLTTRELTGCPDCV